MNDHLKILVSTLGDTRVKENVRLSDYLQCRTTSLAEAVYVATTSREFTLVVQLCKDLEIPFTIVGSGSKTLLTDQRVPGLVIKNRSDALRLFGIKGKVSREGIGIEEALLEADSGVSLEKLAAYATMQKLTGFESLRVSVGTIGGSLHSNLSLREKTHQVKVFAEYESSVLKTLDEVDLKDVIISVTFKLKSKI